MKIKIILLYQVSIKIVANLTMANMGNVPEQANKWTKGKMTIVPLRKQTGFNQDFEFRCFCGKYQVFLFHQDSVIFSNRTNSEQEKIRIPYRPFKGYTPLTHNTGEPSGK